MLESNAPLAGEEDGFGVVGPVEAGQGGGGGAAPPAGGGGGGGGAAPPAPDYV